MIAMIAMMLYLTLGKFPEVFPQQSAPAIADAFRIFFSLTELLSKLSFVFGYHFSLGCFPK